MTKMKKHRTKTGHLQVPFKTKAADDDGHFVGYAAVFNNVDLGGDVILPGAFKEFNTNDKGEILIALHHDLQATIAHAKFEQDEYGLRVEGNVVTELYDGKQAYIRMKNDLLSAMSIGYNILKDGYEYDEEKGIFLLKRLKLIEASFVTVGMNPKAKLVDLKTATNEREFEHALREAGLSNKAATAVTLHGFKGLSNRDDSGATDKNSEMLKSLRDSLLNFKL